VTRLGEFSPFGRLLETVGDLKKIYKFVAIKKLSKFVKVLFGRLFGRLLVAFFGRFFHK
jgi:hypothetical protein